MNVGEIYSSVLQMNPLVPFSPSDFQLQLTLAEDKLYEECYGAIYKQQQGRPPIAYQVTQSITDALQNFATQYVPPFGQISGAYVFPVDYRHGTGINVLIDGIETATITLPIDRWRKAANAKLVTPEDRPISKYDQQKFWVLPRTLLPLLYYLREPIYAVFGYTVTNGYVEYDAGASVQSEFPDFCSPILVSYISRGLGLSNEQWNAIQHFSNQLQVME